MIFVFGIAYEYEILQLSNIETSSFHKAVTTKLYVLFKNRARVRIVGI